MSNCTQNCNQGRACTCCEKQQNQQPAGTQSAQDATENVAEKPLHQAFQPVMDMVNSISIRSDK